MPLKLKTVQALSHLFSDGEVSQDIMNLLGFFSQPEYQYGNSGAAPNIDFTNGPAHALTLTAHANIAFANKGLSGQTYTIKLTQDATGSRTVTWPTDPVLWAGGTPPVLSTAPGAVDIVTLYHDGANFYGVATAKGMA